MKKQLTLREKAIRAYNSMVARCQSNKNYKDVSIHPVWKNDKEAYITYYMTNNTKGWHLDKDLKVPHSNIYSPDTCMFVPPHINQVIRGKKSNSRGNATNAVVLPMGVSNYDNDKKPYQAHCKINDVQTHLGLFKTPEEAHRAWQYGKIDQLQYLLMDDQLNPEIIKAIENWIEVIICDIENGSETIIR